MYEPYEEEDPGEEGKVCCRCERMLPEYEFGLQTRKGEVPVPSYACKQCARDVYRAYRFGRSIEFVKAVQQVPACEICEVPLTNGRSIRGRAIDHCHKTGAIRGVLCGGCNRGLGCAKDSPEILRKMAAYLEANRE